MGAETPTLVLRKRRTGSWPMCGSLQPPAPGVSRRVCRLTPAGFEAKNLRVSQPVFCTVLEPLHSPASPAAEGSRSMGFPRFQLGFFTTPVEPLTARLNVPGPPTG